MAEMRIMGTTPGLRAILSEILPENKIKGGDTKIIWDADNAAEVEVAKHTFDRLKKLGYNAYAVKGKDGSKGETIDKFDADAERLIMAPTMAGG